MLEFERGIAPIQEDRSRKYRDCWIYPAADGLFALERRGVMDEALYSSVDACIRSAEYPAGYVKALIARKGDRPIIGLEDFNG